MYIQHRREIYQPPACIYSIGGRPINRRHVYTKQSERNTSIAGMYIHYRNSSKSTSRPSGMGAGPSLQSSSFLIHNSSFLIHNPSFLIHNPLFVIHNSSFLIQNSSFYFKNHNFRTVKRAVIAGLKDRSEEQVLKIHRTLKRCQSIIAFQVSQ